MKKESIDELSKRVAFKIKEFMSLEPSQRSIVGDYTVKEFLFGKYLDLYSAFSDELKGMIDFVITNDIASYSQFAKRFNFTKFNDLLKKEIVELKNVIEDRIREDKNLLQALKERRKNEEEIDSIVDLQEKITKEMRIDNRLKNLVD